MEEDGWNYREKPKEGDARKFVTLEQDGFVWVGIRAWNITGKYWMNGNEPEKARVKAWKDLEPPAKGFYQRGILHIPKTA